MNPDSDNDTATSDIQQPPVDAYYDSVKGTYLVENIGGRWLAHSELAFKRILASAGISAAKDKETGLSPADAVILHIQNTRDITFVGPLAGWGVGMHIDNGSRFFVTDPPRPPQRRPGDFPVIEAILTGLFSDGEIYGSTQIDLLLSWVSTAVKTMAAKQFRTGQALLLAGPPGCGKSYFQTQILTPLLGGRMAKCANAFLGGTNFNGELFSAEHLVMEDEFASTKFESRRALGACIRQVTSNVLQYCHPKSRPAITLRPFWRLSVSFNDDPDRIQVVPIMEDDLHNKIILLSCHKFDWPMPFVTAEDKEALTAVIQSELPAFMDFLLTYEIPETVRDERYGVRGWQHPEIMRKVNQVSPEGMLNAIIAGWMTKESSDEWEGTASQLRSQLVADGDFTREVNELIRSTKHAGYMVARMAGMPCERYAMPGDCYVDITRVNRDRYKFTRKVVEEADPF